MIDCGILGCGVMGALRGQALSRTDGCRLIGVADTDREVAEALAAKLGCPALEPATLFSRAELLCVSADTPAHADLIRAAAGQVRVLLCESPQTTSSNEGSQLLDTCQKAGTQLLMSSYRAIPAFQTLQQAVANQEVGEAQMFRLRLCSPPPSADGRGDRPVASTLMLEAAAPALDATAWLLGDIQRVFAQASQGEPPVILATIRCAGDKLAHLEFNWSQPAGSQPMFNLEISADAGVLTFDSRKDMAIDMAAGPGVAGLRAPYLPWPVSGTDPIQAEVAAAVGATGRSPLPYSEALATGAANLSPLPFPDRDQVLRSLQAAEALERSIAENRPQSLPQREGEAPC